MRSSSSPLIREMLPGEEAAVAALCLRSFGAGLAESLSEKGIEVFVRMLTPESLADRGAGEGTLFFVAEMDGAIIGAIGTQDGNRIFLLFVAPAFQRRGLGRALIDRAGRSVKARWPAAGELTVLVPRAAVSAFEGIGFRRAGSEGDHEDIVSLPMRRSIRPKNQ